MLGGNAIVLPCERLTHIQRSKDMDPTSLDPPPPPNAAAHSNINSSACVYRWKMKMSYLLPTQTDPGGHPHRSLL